MIIIKDIKIQKLNIKFATGPAKTVNDRDNSDAPSNVLSLLIPLFAGLLTNFELSFSFKNLTNPPRGNKAICHCVPCLSVVEKITGPKPMENTSAFIPHQRPTI